MSHALVFIADGFEEIEALTSVDLLRRGGVDVKTVSVGGGNLRKGAHGVQILCDTLLSSADWDQADMLVLPGGWPGAENLGQDTVLTGKLKEFAADPKKWVAAICAAPMCLAVSGCCAESARPAIRALKSISKADVTGGRVERDGHIITGRGPGTASDFALELVEVLEGKEKAEDVRDGLAG